MQPQMKIIRLLSSLLTIAISLVWLINGFFCKVLNLVPRHELIVSRILGPSHAHVLTTIIGISEILMAVWVISGIKSRLCAIFQMIIVTAMNIIEFIVVPELLLFGRLNIVIASGFIATVYLNEFILKMQLKMADL